jgi:hypothetical protein
MALLPSPAALRRALGRNLTNVVRRALRIQKTPLDAELTKVPDDLPRDMLFAQPIVATAKLSGNPETLDDGTARVAFTVLVKDAEGKRCPDLWVQARIVGPERTAVGDTTTNMLGTATFRMAGPAGTYAIEVLDVAAQALAWDRDASTLTVSASVS